MAIADDHLEQLTNLARAKAFLGREFLTWLWYTAETSRERLRLPIGGKEQEVDLWVDDRLVLEGTATMSHQNVMKGGDPSRSREAAASLATGKTVREMKVGLRIKGGGEYFAILGENDLNPRSLKLPSPTPTEDEPEGKAVRALPIGERLKATESFLAVLDALFARFLAQRVEPTWETTGLSEMRSWIKQRQSKQDPDTLH